jgi:ribosome maturation factor RimP
VGSFTDNFPRRNLELFDLDRTKGIIEKVVSSEGLELVEVEFKGNLNNQVLRIYIDKPSGVTHQDCEFISDQVGTVLDVEDLIPGSYTLEVSSPGLTRKLTKDSDFHRFRGRLVKIQTKVPIKGARNFRGTLVGLDGETVTVKLKESELVLIPLRSIAKANLDIDF